MCCNAISCENQILRDEFDTFFRDIVGVLQDSGEHIVAEQSKHQNRPGWSDYVADLYQFSRETFKLWQNNGKPRQGPIHNVYTQSKRRFKYALRYIKKHENNLRREAIAKKVF